MPHNLHHTLKTFIAGNGATAQYYSLPALETAGIAKISRLPISIRIVLESILRNYDDKKITVEHIQQLAHWQPNATRTDEIPFVVSRVVLQDFTGVPLLADLAAMRNEAEAMNHNPKIIEPLVPVDLVVDHSVMVDQYASPTALRHNMELEFERNNERYQFMKWGMQAFDTFKVVPPGIGIVHQDFITVGNDEMIDIRGRNERILPGQWQALIQFRDHAARCPAPRTASGRCPPACVSSRAWPSRRPGLAPAFSAPARADRPAPERRTRCSRQSRDNRFRPPSAPAAARPGAWRPARQWA